MGQERLEAFTHIKVKVDKQKDFHEKKGNYIEFKAISNISGMIQNMINMERGEFPKEQVKPHLPYKFTDPNVSEG